MNAIVTLAETLRAKSNEYTAEAEALAHAGESPRLHVRALAMAVAYMEAAQLVIGLIDEAVVEYRCLRHGMMSHGGPASGMCPIGWGECPKLEPVLVLPLGES